MSGYRYNSFKLLISPLLFIIFNIHIEFINAQCSWDYNNGTSVQCNLRILDKSGLDLQGAEGMSKLLIQCSDQITYESQLGHKIFNKLQTISELDIESCKLLQLHSNAFDGLTTLKTLRLNTFNDFWSPAKSLDIKNDTFNGLRELQVLNLADNNIRALPVGFMCPLNNLQTFNVTRNRIRTAEHLGLTDEKQCNGGAELQILDISHNELKFIPENWGVSRLRRLQQLLLQNNNLTDLSGESFAGLSSLRVLNISYNHLETLPQSLFVGSRELREIHLNNNDLFELPKGIFHRLEQLLVLDLSSNQLSSNHIDNTTFSGLIRLIILNLAHNALTRIDSQTFKELYFLQILNLRNNSIGYIEENAFLPLYNLHTLNLAENRLHTLDNKLFNGLFVLSKLTLNNNLINIIEPSVFKNCSDLKELDLSSNQLNEIPIALQDLTMLRTLDLGENQITTFHNGSFRNLNQLTGLRLIDNQIGNITKGMLWDLPRLSVLNLAKNHIQNIEQGAFERNIELEAIRLDRNFISDINGVFAALASLMWLNLSENHLVWFDFAFIPSKLKWLDIHKNYIESLGNYYKLQEEIHVKTLDASFNRITEIGPISVPNSIELLFINNNEIKLIHPNTFVDKVNLSRVDLYANSLTKLQLNTLRLAPVPDDKKIPEFYMGGNPFECDCSMEWLQRVNNLTSRQHPKVGDLENIQCAMPHSRGNPIRHLATLNQKDFLCRYETHCFALCHCCEFDACDCEMTCPTNCTCYHDQTWGTNVVDCGGHKTYQLPKRIPMDATVVYLDGNNFPELQNHAFIGRKNLQSLYVNMSNVESIQNRTFAGLTSLQSLHLEDNKIHTLHGYEFEQIGHLKELYLQNNLLTTIANVTLAPLISLQVLRIDGNRISTISIWQWEMGSQMKNMYALSIGRNNWSCRCKFLQDLKSFVVDNALIIQDPEDIYCLDGGVKRELDFNTTSACTDFYASGNGMNGHFPTMYVPLFVSILTLIGLLVILIIVFVFREPLRVWLFAHYGVRMFAPRCEESEKLYDAVLLHSAKDADHITREVVTELEMGRPPLRICVQHRDLLPEPTNIQILEACRVSRRVIMILSRNFMQTEWSRCDFRRAVHESLIGRPHKLVIIEESDLLFEAENDAELIPYLKSVAVSRIKRSDRFFWDKLRYALPAELPYRGNNYTLDHHERIKHPMSPGVLLRQAPPPAYYPDHDDTNYSSATTATPSPRPNRHGLVELPQRPPSEHIYSSIDSDYGGADNENAPIGIHRPSWRTNTITSQHSNQHHGGQHVQAYLV